MEAFSIASSARANQLRMLLSRHAHRLPPLASTVLVLVLAWLAARLVWALVPAPITARWTPPPPVPQIHGTASQTTKGATRLEAAVGLFGVDTQTTDERSRLSAASIHALATAPETHLNLKLLGILADRLVPSMSRALVASGNNDERPYSLGQAITSGVLLKAIFPDRIVLSRNGRLETLRLEMAEANTGSASNDVPIAVAGQATGKAAKLSSIRTQLLSNPALAARFIRVRPVKSGNKQIGYRIYPGPDHTAFKATGLHAGDIVTAVNGVALSNPAQTLQLLSELSQAQQVNLTIKRGSKTINTTLNFAR